MAVMLAACVTTPRTLPPLDVVQQRQLLQNLPKFQLSGRVAVARGDEGFNAAVAWRQQQDTSTIKLSGPLGAGGLELRAGPQGLQVVTSRGVLDGQEAEAALERELGFVPPLAALRYWMLGLAAPEDASAVQTTDADGLLVQLVQQQWLIVYDRHQLVETAAGGVQMPARLTATREGLRLRLVVDRWRLH